MSLSLLRCRLELPNERKDEGLQTSRSLPKLIHRCPPLLAGTNTEEVVVLDYRTRRFNGGPECIVGKSRVFINSPIPTFN